MTYVYPAIFTPEETIAGAYFIEFPDLPNVVTQGGNLYQAVVMAEDVLALALMTMEDDGEIIPEATAAYEIKATEQGAFVAVVKADTDAYRKMLAQTQKQSASGAA